MPSNSAEIRPEVGGRIAQVLFEDGQNVKAGDVLFVIDPRPYPAAVARAEANLASAQTNAGFAKLEFDRANGLLKSEAIAQHIYDERANTFRVNTAAVKAAEAALKEAQLDLEHAHVKAPAAPARRADGRQSGPAGAECAAADHDCFERHDLCRFRRGRADLYGQHPLTPSPAAMPSKIPVQLTVQDDKGHSYKGTIYSFDNRIDVTSGTIRAPGPSSTMPMARWCPACSSRWHSPTASRMTSCSSRNARSVPIRARNSSMSWDPTTRSPIARSNSAGRFSRAASC